MADARDLAAKPKERGVRDLQELGTQRHVLAHDPGDVVDLDPWVLKRGRQLHVRSRQRGELIDVPDQLRDRVVIEHRLEHARPLDQLLDVSTLERLADLAVGLAIEDLVLGGARHRDPHRVRLHLLALVKQALSAAAHHAGVTDDDVEVVVPERVGRGEPIGEILQGPLFLAVAQRAIQALEQAGLVIDDENATFHVGAPFACYGCLMESREPTSSSSRCSRRSRPSSRSRSSFS